MCLTFFCGTHSLTCVFYANHIPRTQQPQVAMALLWDSTVLDITELLDQVLVPICESSNYLYILINRCYYQIFLIFGQSEG